MLLRVIVIWTLDWFGTITPSGLLAMMLPGPITTSVALKPTWMPNCWFGIAALLAAMPMRLLTMWLPQSLKSWMFIPPLALLPITFDAMVLLVTPSWMFT